MKSLKEKMTKASVDKATSAKQNKIVAGVLAGVAAVSAVTVGVHATQTALTNIANSIQQTFAEIYSAVIMVSSVIAIALIAVCLILRMISKNPRTAEEATSWIKRIAITWLCLMMLSVFLQYGLQLVTNSGANTSTPW